MARTGLDPVSQDTRPRGTGFGRGRLRGVGRAARRASPERSLQTSRLSRISDDKHSQLEAVLQEAYESRCRGCGPRRPNALARSCALPRIGSRDSVARRLAMLVPKSAVESGRCGGGTRTAPAEGVYFEWLTKTSRAVGLAIVARDLLANPGAAAAIHVARSAGRTRAANELLDFGSRTRPTVCAGPACAIARSARQATCHPSERAARAVTRRRISRAMRPRDALHLESARDSVADRLGNTRPQEVPGRRMLAAAVHVA